MYTFQSRVRYSEVDAEGKLKLESLLDYFQDVSTFQSEDLGVGLYYLKEMDWAWVLSSWQIVVNRYPALGEQVVAGTFPYEFKGFLGKRNFLLQTTEGEVLAYADSLWSLLNMKKMLPEKPTPLMLERYELQPPYPMQYCGRKIALGTLGEEKESFVVKPHHLDTNDHVNNGQYVRMALEFVPAGVLVAQLRAEYKKSAKLGDVITPVLYSEEDRFVVELRANDQKPYAVVELITKVI